MEDQQLKDLLAFAIGQKKAQAEASPLTGLASFNENYLKAQAQSPSLQPESNINPSELSANRELERQGAASLAAQQEELNRQRDLAKIYAGAGSGHADLTPLLQYSSQMTGTDIAKGYKAPPTAAESAQQAQGMYSQIPKLQDQLSDNRLNLLKMKLASAQHKGDVGRQQRFEEVQENQLHFKVKAPYTKLQTEKNQFDQSYGTIVDALDRGDISSVQGSLSNLARISGEKGVLTDQDIIRVVPINLQGKMTSLLANLRSDPSTKVPTEIINALKRNVNAINENHIKTFKNSLEAAYALDEAAGGKIKDISGRQGVALLKLLQPKQAKASGVEELPSYEEWKASKK